MQLLAVLNGIAAWLLLICFAADMIFYFLSVCRKGIVGQGQQEPMFALLYGKSEATKAGRR